VDTRRPLEVLLVEDNPGDARLTAEILKDGSSGSTLRVVADGVEALDYLQRRGRYRDVRRPDIILLDLNLPRKSGRELLAEIKADPALKTIPVVVLTTSQAESDIAQSYTLHANAYLVKPIELDGFARVMHAFRLFWLETAVLPRLPGDGSV